MNEQWNDLFSVFGFPWGGFDKDAQRHYSDLEQLMQNDAAEMALEGRAARAFSLYTQHQAELLEDVSLQNFKAGIFFALWLTGSTFFQVI